MPSSEVSPRPGVAFVISAPSGGGKTTMCRRLMDELGDIAFSVSHTTRPPRGEERDGVDYHFVDVPTFEKMVAEDAFVEWARVHNRLYGTTHREVASRLGQGRDVLFEIDVQGGKQIASRLPHVALIFIVPPAMDVLARRLRQRQSDLEAEVDRRLAAAASEMRAATFYTYWIVNDDLDRAVAALKAIVRAERLRVEDKEKMLAQLLARADGTHGG